MQQEKEKLAREWLANLKPLLGLDKADDEKSNNKKTKKTSSSSSSSSMKKSAAALGRGGNKYADVSDDDDEEGGRKRGGAGGDKENIAKRHKDAFVKVRCCGIFRVTCHGLSAPSTQPNKRCE